MKEYSCKREILGKEGLQGDGYSLEEGTPGIKIFLEKVTPGKGVLLIRGTALYPFYRK